MADFEGLKQFFGDDGSKALTYDELMKGVNEKGIKLADLSLGGYVARDKYDEQTRKFNQYKTDNDVSKYADYDAIKQELEAFRTEKADRELLEKLSAKKVKPEFQKFVLAEVKGKVTDEVTFDKAMESYLKDNAQYIASEESVKTFFKNSSVPLEGGAGTKSGTNAKMNGILRSGFGYKN